MSISLTSRGLSPRRPRRRLTTFVSLLWLNLAMLPCTMAVAGDERGAKPDCPPTAAATHQELMAGHGPHADHARHGGADAHAGHIDDDGKHPCLSGGDCCELDDVLFSDGAKKLDRDSAVLPLIVLETVSTDLATDAVRRPFATGPPPQFAGAVRRHAFHCVYRD